MKSERRNIAVFRLQATHYVATHVGYRDTEVYGTRTHYLHRHCVWPACTGKLDDTAHVLLHCPLHTRARARLMSLVADALLPTGATLSDLGADLDVCRLLLGSPPAHVAGFLATSPTAYRDILRASAAFLRNVYITRWVHPRRSGQ